MDLAAIAAAIADLFDPAGITPPTGLTNIRQSTHRLPQAITHTPQVLVFPPEMQWKHGASQRTGDLLFLVRWYIGMTSDLPRAVDAAYAWHDVLLERMVGQVQLGEAAQGVTHANWTDSRIALLVYPNPALMRDGAEPASFMGIEAGVLVHVAQGMTYTA